MTPDLITFAKGSNSGYVPVGGVIISEAIRQTFDQRVYPGGLTYSGHPLACASIVATIKAMKEEGIVEHSAALGENVIGPALREHRRPSTLRSARSAAWAPSGRSTWCAARRRARCSSPTTPPAPTPPR